MIHFSFAPLGLTEKLIALLSGRPSPLAAYSTIPYTPSIQLCFQLVPSLFPPSSFLLMWERETQVVTPEGSSGTYSPIFKVFCLSLLILPQKPSVSTYFVAACQMGHNVSEQTNSLHRQLSSEDQTMWLNKQVRAQIVKLLYDAKVKNMCR